MTADEVHPEQGGLPAPRDGQLVPRRRTRTLAEMLDQITPENLHPEQDAGPPVGSEEW